MAKIFKHFSIFLFILVLFVCCNDNYNDTIKWMDSIEIDTNIQTIKENQPDFIVIDWGNGIFL